MITLENYDFSDLEVLWIADRKRSTKIITSLQYKCQQRWLYQDTRRCRQLQWLRQWPREWWWWYWWYDKRFRYRQLLLNHDRRSRIYNFNNFVQNNLENYLLSSSSTLPRVQTKPKPKCEPEFEPDTSPKPGKFRLE